VTCIITEQTPALQAESICEKKDPTVAHEIMLLF
jgi:hypothetical protein